MSNSVVDDDIVRFFGRHIVGLYCRHASGIEIATGFVIAVCGKAAIVTAGHFVRQIQSFAQKELRLADCWGSNSTNGDSLIVHDGIDMVAIDRENLVDYGVIVPDYLLCRALEANGVIPFSERAWALPPQKPDYHFIIGFPSEHAAVLSVYAGGYNLRLNLIMHTVTCVDERPPELPEGGYGYWHIERDRANLASIKGLSGGPIIAVKKVGRKAKYWPVAIQSGWHQGTGNMYASSLAPLGRALSTYIAC